MNFTLPLPPEDSANHAELVVAITKVADIMEAIWFITHEGVGYHPYHVRDYLYAKLEDAVFKLCLVVGGIDSQTMYYDTIEPMLDRMICGPFVE